LTDFNYIIFEGIDGSGKSTQAQRLGKVARQENITPIFLSEPTRGRFGLEVRGLMSAHEDVPIERQIELFTKDREEHVETKIKPLLDFMRDRDNFMIIQDRSYLSAPAYQGRSPKGMQSLLEMQRKIAPPPDIIFLIDVPVNVAIARLNERQNGKAIFENESFLDEVRTRYLDLASSVDENIVVIDGLGSEHEVSETIAKHLWPEQ